MQKLKVHILEFINCENTHIEIVLEYEEDGRLFFYNINAWALPYSKFQEDDLTSLEMLRSAHRSVAFYIMASGNKIMDDWNSHYRNSNFGVFNNNCADVVKWFLHAFTPIKVPGPCALPITCNYLCCGFFAPSFLQIGITIPGRVIDVVEDYLKKHRLARLAVSDGNLNERLVMQ